MIPLLCIVGPTASGKSALALSLCERLGGEIVSCDSMQIYRGCDIATAKPSPDEQARVPHHLIDICDPNERFSAAQWAQQAVRCIADIQKRGRVAVVCGGTGFYLRALLQPELLSEVAPDETLRAQLEDELNTHGPTAMHHRLARMDDQAASRLHPNDAFRTLRALEIALSAGSKVSPTKPEAKWMPFVLGIEWPREVLYARINERVDAMMDAGFRQELEGLVAQWSRNAPALGGVGYKQMMPTLDDESQFALCLEAWKRDTRRYAKRQMTWFRHQLNVHWLDGSDANLREQGYALSRAFLTSHLNNLSNSG